MEENTKNNVAPVTANESDSASLEARAEFVREYQALVSKYGLAFSPVEHRRPSGPDGEVVSSMGLEIVPTQQGKQGG